MTITLFNYLQHTRRYADYKMINTRKLDVTARQCSIACECIEQHYGQTMQKNKSSVKTEWNSEILSRSFHKKLAYRNNNQNCFIQKLLQEKLADDNNYIGNDNIALLGRNSIQKVLPGSGICSNDAILN